MIESKRRAATSISWKSPEDHAVTLTPLLDRGGLLEVEIDNGAVTIFGKSCRLTTADSKNDRQRHKTISDAEITIPLSQCEIHWTLVEDSAVK